jgi:7-cyano-7-deazaguanine synthase
VNVAYVLLSGGMDSVAALHWARLELRFSGPGSIEGEPAYDRIAAIGFAYGQPQRQAELTVAGALCQRLGVPYTVLEIGEAVRGLTTLHVPPPGKDASGVSRANVPLRNLVMLSVAAAEAARNYAGAETVVDLIGGWNIADCSGFPDCRPEFLIAARRVINEGLRGVVRDMIVTAPFGRWHKDDILHWASKKGVLAACSEGCTGRASICERRLPRQSAWPRASVIWPRRTSARSARVQRRARTPAGLPVISIAP